MNQNSNYQAGDNALRLEMLLELPGDVSTKVLLLEYHLGILPPAQAGIITEALTADAALREILKEVQDEHENTCRAPEPEGYAGYLLGLIKEQKTGPKAEPTRRYHWDWKSPLTIKAQPLMEKLSKIWLPQPAPALGAKKRSAPGNVPMQALAPKSKEGKITFHAEPVKQEAPVPMLGCRFVIERNDTCPPHAVLMLYRKSFAGEKPPVKFQFDQNGRANVLLDNFSTTEQWGFELETFQD